MDLVQRLKILEEENDRLRERISDLESALFGGERSLPLEWRLTAQEARVFGALLARECATKHFVMAALYAGKPEADEAGSKICDVFICKIRRKLAPFGIEILTDHGIGWRLHPRIRKDFLAGGVNARRSDLAVA